ncbi:hypothetical protein IWX76_000544 [Pedobacter sp. CAN_A7]|uniref:DUF922 domain-containing protein n=1 Tax=Pedobacter sp. CAN_A7 TaxID=2787722 RepID=UPI0018C8DE13
MTKKLLGAITVTFLLLHINTSVKAQDYRQLNVSDFKSLPDLNRSFAAFIFWEVHYKYTFFHPAKKLELAVGLHFMHDKSWFLTDRLSEEQVNHLLNHEQMHFAIGEMMKREVKKTLSNFKYSKNFRTEIDSLFKLTNVKYRQLDQQYDRETNHSRDTVSQKRWDAYIKSNLELLE